MGIGQQESRGRAPLRRSSGAYAGGKSADSNKRGANGKSRRRRVDKVSSALCGSPGEDKMEFEAVGALVLAGQALRWPSRQLGVVFLVTQMVQCKSICSRFGVRIRLWQEQVPFTEERHQLSVKWDAVVGQKRNWLPINSAVSDLEQGPVPEQVVVSSGFEVRV